MNDFEKSDLDFSRQDILQMLSDEKSAYTAYKSLCERFSVCVDNQATIVHQTRVNLLTKILDGQQKSKKLIQKY
jgi:hypothetical protein